MRGVLNGPHQMRGLLKGHTDSNAKSRQKALFEARDKTSLEHL